MTQRERIVSHFTPKQRARLGDLGNSYPSRYLPTDYFKLTQLAVSPEDAHTVMPQRYGNGRRSETGKGW